MKIIKRVVIGLGFVLVVMAGTYALNPAGTASTELRGRVFGYTIYQVPSVSSSPKLNPGDYVFVSTFAYVFEPPNRGDFVIFIPPGGDPPYVKRVIGLPGELIRVAGGATTINGQHVREPYVVPKNNRLPFELEEQSVPPEHVFVMGDNRDRSMDSRSFGSVPIGSIIGKAAFVIQ